MTAVPLSVRLPARSGLAGRPLLAASWLAVQPRRLLLPAGAALLLVAVTWPWLDDGYAGLALHGVTLLLACSVALTTDDPGAEVVAATPIPRSRRTLARLGVGLAVAAPVYAVAALVAHSRFPAVSLTAHTVEVVVLVLVAATIGAWLRALGRALPAYPAVLGTLLLMFGLYALPRSFRVIDPQPWGAPWEAAMLRWAALALLALAALVHALRDPAR